MCLVSLVFFHSISLIEHESRRWNPIEAAKKAAAAARERAAAAAAAARQRAAAAAAAAAAVRQKAAAAAQAARVSESDDAFFDCSANTRALQHSSSLFFSFTIISKVLFFNPDHAPLVLCLHLQMPVRSVWQPLRPSAQLPMESYLLLRPLLQCEQCHLVDNEVGFFLEFIALALSDDRVRPHR